MCPFGEFAQGYPELRGLYREKVQFESSYERVKGAKNQLLKQQTTGLSTTRRTWLSYKPILNIIFVKPAFSGMRKAKQKKRFP
jgi:hypothetical protein